jgi:hypothetical protein
MFDMYHFTVTVVQKCLCLFFDVINLLGMKLNVILGVARNNVPALVKNVACTVNSFFCLIVWLLNEALHSSYFRLNYMCSIAQI